MISIRIPVVGSGVDAACAAVRATMSSLGGDADAAALLTRLLVVDAAQRLQGGEEDGTAVVDLEVDGTQLLVTVRDRGVPVTGPPVTLVPLLEGGFATSAQARTDVAGNITELRLALPSHHQMFVPNDEEVLQEDSALSDEEVTVR